MAHYKIFQISREPITLNDYLDEDRYFEWFVPSVADYVTPLTEEERTWFIKEWLTDHGPGPGLVFDPAEATFTIQSKVEYFKGKYERVRRHAQELLDMDVEGFANYAGEEAVREIEWEGNDKYSYYIDDGETEFGFMSLDSFMREVKNGDKFYIGNVFDYHY